MKPGNLVKINRAAIGIPAGTMGLIMETHAPRADSLEQLNEKIHTVKLLGLPRPDRRYLTRDLEVISS